MNACQSYVEFFIKLNTLFSHFQAVFKILFTVIGGSVLNKVAFSTRLLYICLTLSIVDFIYFIALFDLFVEHVYDQTDNMKFQILQNTKKTEAVFESSISHWTEI